MTVADTFGECPVCREGSLVAMKSRATGVLLLVCDDCESMWQSPTDAHYYDRALTHEPKDLVAATREELTANEWQSPATLAGSQATRLHLRIIHGPLDAYTPEEETTLRSLLSSVPGVMSIIMLRPNAKGGYSVTLTVESDALNQIHAGLAAAGLRAVI